MAVTHVTRSNLREVLPRIKEELEECEFVAIDAEFSGINLPEEQFSLFDTPAERYEKMKGWPYRILQFGLAIFKFDMKTNQWHPSCYNCMVFPAAFEAEKLTDTMLCQASSLVFLSQHNFDFNKWIAEGIPYMNAEKARNVKRYLEKHRSCLQNGSPVDLATLSTTQVYQRRASEETVKGPLTDADILEIIQDLKGFSHVIEAISQSGKYVVGHNVFIDLFLTYKDFCDSSPDTYSELKSQLHAIFPYVIDTKRLAHGIKDVLSSSSITDGVDLNVDANLLTDTNLFALHFNTQLTEKFSPTIVVGDEYKSLLEQAARRRIESIPNSLCHEAAFDACVTGCLLIQLAYLLERPALRFRISHATAGDLLYACHPWLNMVNATRCTVPYINIAGEDPGSHRPPTIIVIGRRQMMKKKKKEMKAFSNGNLAANLHELHKNLAKFGDYDMKVKGTEIIITCGNHGCYKGVRRYLAESGFMVRDNQWKWLGVLEEWNWLAAAGGVSMVIGAMVVWCFSRSSLPKGM